MRIRLSTALRGGAAGVTATAAMSAVLGAGRRLGLLPSLPPRRIVDHLLPGLPDEVADTAATVLHVGYGAAAGSLLALLGGRGPRLGAVYGLLLWAASYEGWVPVIGALPPAHRDQRSRVAVMVAAHVVYGAVLGRRLAR